MSEPAEKLRIDKWLWAARFCKTRGLAADVVESGKVLVNEARAKPAKLVGPGDRLDIRLGQYHYVVDVLAISNRRGPAPEAQKLYRETAESLARREEIVAQLREQPKPFNFKGRPTKRDRREISRFEDQSRGERRSAWGDFE